MKNRISATGFVATILAVMILMAACRKINESTELGAGLIPPVDNITTFDTSLTVLAYNDTFGLANDSQYLARSEEMFLGRINNDPFFGKTDARMFFELKPVIYGAYPFARPDSVKIDSIVLSLSYLETYGDTNTVQQIKVYELDHSNNFRYDSAYLVRQENLTYNTANPLSLPNQNIIPRNLNDSVKIFQDTTVNMMRIKLDTNFARRLFNYDTTNAYKTDSIFRDRFRGFAVRSEGTGNAVMGFDLADINTRLSFYYRIPKKGSTAFDSTVVSYFFFTTLSAAANYVKRDYAGSPMGASIGGTAPDPFVYLQNSPGTFALLKIPDLPNLSNRLIHRAELVVEQQYDVQDSMFYAPELLYLDAYDPSITSNNYQFRTIPYDLAYTPNGFDLRTFGCVPENAKDPSGNPVKIWRFNVSRYIQHVLTKTQKVYDLRLSAPFIFNEQYGLPPGTDLTYTIPVNPTILKGRFRAIGNTGPGDTNPRRLRLRLIYSKL